MTKFRLEAISDAVFAIVMTLLVIEIKVPHLKEYSSASLIDGLIELLPLFFAFFLSFAMLTATWFTHNFMFTLLAKNITRKLVNANFIFLALICLVPFSSALLGEYPQSKVAVFVYSSNILAIGIFNYLIREFIFKDANIENPDPKELNLTNIDLFYGTVRIGITVIGSLIAMLLSFVSTYASLALLVAQVIVLIVPGLVGWFVRIFGLERFAPVVDDIDNAIDKVSEAIEIPKQSKIDKKSKKKRK